MMPRKRLQAKTQGGRPEGYTALHLACNGSDRIFQRHTIVELLLRRNADVNALDDKGRTPLHHAAGTGVLEAAKLLVGAGAVIDAVDDAGKNALDKCTGSSGTLYRSRMGGNLWVRELLV
jgi:ankyrin repeat protein